VKTILKIDLPEDEGEHALEKEHDDYVHED
jgi:hypothetical protein